MWLKRFTAMLGIALMLAGVTPGTATATPKVALHTGTKMPSYGTGVTLAAITGDVSLSDAGVATVTGATRFSLGAATGKTLSSNAFAISAGVYYYTVAGQGGADDDLDSITGAAAGDVLFLRPTSDTVTITIRDTGGGSGNIRTPGAKSIALAEDDDWAMLMYGGTNWTVLAFKVLNVSGGGLGAKLFSVTSGEGAALVKVEDAGSYWALTTVEAVLDEIKTQLGGATSTTYNFTNGTGTRLTDNDAVYAALNKLDQGFVDLKSTSNAKGASLTGVEDSAGYFAASNVETVTAEIGTYLPIALTDPGSGAAIPVTRSASVAITTNGAETNTLAIPTFRGQVLDLFLDTDTSGARVITSAQRINQTGNTVMTLTEAQDYIRLVAVTVGGALRWQVAANDGVALSGP